MPLCGGAPKPAPVRGTTRPSARPCALRSHTGRKEASAGNTICRGGTTLRTAALVPRVAEPGPGP
eukprot:2755758-Alexandrium_andersonii.AAC.1